ncbi:MAG: hypothetical protein M1470_07235 [Bacteroidetes bacterium]|nr:hypothetical protein [Bacteroidota bacterium]
MKSKTLLQYILAILIGGFFIISGVGKILNVGQLIETIQNYGVPPFLAPAAIFLPPLEIILGILIIMPATRKAASGVVLMLLLIFTGAYLYAHFFRGVQGCGCSGEFSFLDMNLPELLVRNAVLFVMALAVFRISGSVKTSLLRWQKALVFVVAVLSSTAAGASSVEPLVQGKDKWIGEDIYSTSLSHIISTNRDSTYLLFFYNMDCPHCWDAIENVKALQRKNVVDKVVGCSFGNDASLSRFESYFHPNFETKLLPVEELRTITRSVPLALLVRRDTIMYAEQGKVSSPLIYQKYVLKKGGDIHIPF